VVGVAEAAWVRVLFDEAELAPGAFIKITSLTDGHAQFLDAQSVRQWAFTSAYFNGDSVRVEVFGGDEPSRVKVSRVLADVVPGWDARSICGTVDDRALSSDPRAARLLSIGCTAWLFNNRQNCLLTAGHCGPSAGYVVQFNVPLSTSGGGLVNPGPEDQYPVDPSSIQTNGGGGVGNDWATFGVFDNSNTGLSPFASQGATYQLAGALPPNDGRAIRVTGYGTTSSPVSPTWNQVQKTHAGPFAGAPGTSLQYRPDTTGGNSGSPVIDDVTGLAIGIHTHGGCTSSGGANQGTQITYAPAQAAINAPLGTCFTPGLLISFPGGRPSLIDPQSGGAFAVSIVPDAGVSLVSGSARVFVDTGSGFVDLPMAGGGTGFTASLPGDACGDTVSYYVQATASTGEVVRSPVSGAYTVLAADGLQTFIAENFQTNTGWTAQNTSLTTGAWVRGVPGNFGRSDPTSDADGSGSCFVTGNTNAEDVDGGPTRLVSPAYDLSGAAGAELSYAVWFNHNGVAPTVQGTVEYSTNGGTTWTLLQSLASSASWQRFAHVIGAGVPAAADVRLRVSAQDNPNTYVVEAGFDDLRATAPVCFTCPADLTGDGEVDSGDLALFIEFFLAQNVAADVTGDGEVDSGDLALFIEQFLAGCGG
jgi:V8-like Glu-specific endopeptidase